MKALNHTNSIQIRDIYKLPMIHLSNEDKTELIDLVKSIIKSMEKNLDFDYTKQQEKIDQIIERSLL